MANLKAVKQTIGTPTMFLGGRERTLQFDLNAFAELEERFGSVDAAMEEMQKGRMKDIRYILWAALIHDEAVIDEVTGEPIKYNITPYQVGGWILPTHLKDVSQKMMQAMGASLPEQEAALKAMEQGVPEGMATVVYTEEEKAQMEQEVKNG